MRAQVIHSDTDIRGDWRLFRPKVRYVAFRPREHVTHQNESDGICIEVPAGAYVLQEYGEPEIPCTVVSEEEFQTYLERLPDGLLVSTVRVSVLQMKRPFILANGRKKAEKGERFDFLARLETDGSEYFVIPKQDLSQLYEEVLW